jgi:hypothetical protein
MRRTSSIGIGTAIMVCLLSCCGCGGSLQDTPDPSKGPSLSAAKSKQMEELKAQAKAGEAKGKKLPGGRGPR